MSKTLQLIKDKTWSFLRGQPGAVSFEYVLVLGGVSVIAVGLLALGADAIMKELLIEGVCESFDDLIWANGQWWCHGGAAFWGW